MKTTIRVLAVFLSVFAFTQCQTEGGQTNPNLLPYSTDAPGEIYISMDSAQWYGAIGDKIREILMAEIEGLPREEYLFTLRYIKPQNMSSTLRQVSNLIYVTTFDVNTRQARIIQNYFPEESKEKIKSNPSYFLSTSKDVYARNQNVMYLFGQSEGSLLNNLEDNQQRIADFFNRVERNRTESEIFKALDKGISKAIGDKFGVSLKIPKGYDLAQIENNFVWIVLQDQKVDKHIHLSYTDYYDELQFSNDSIIARRDLLCKKYIYENRDEYPNSFMVTETEVPFIPVKSRQINLGGKYAVETRGLWRTNGHTMGGPFIGITTVDEATNRLYYIEGFIFAPGSDQREFVRELEAIIHSFKTSGELAQ